MRRVTRQRLARLEASSPGLGLSQERVTFWRALWLALAEAGGWQRGREAPSEAAARALGLSSPRELRDLLRDDLADFKHRVLAVKGLDDRLALICSSDAAVLERGLLSDSTRISRSSRANWRRPGSSRTSPAG